MRAGVGWEMDMGDAGMVERSRLRDGDDEDDSEIWDLGDFSRVNRRGLVDSLFPLTAQERAVGSAQLLFDGQYRRRPIRVWQPRPTVAAD